MNQHQTVTDKPYYVAQCIRERSYSDVITSSLEDANRFLAGHANHGGICRLVEGFRSFGEAFDYSFNFDAKSPGC
jgi:hypothetical protein